VSNSTRGEKGNNWQGGKSTENHRIRDGVEMRLWREAVFARDNWTCQKCNGRNGNGKTIYLHSHHIHNFAEVIELRTSIENGITFCKECHRQFHKEYKWKNNTREQLEKFLKVGGQAMQLTQ